MVMVIYAVAPLSMGVNCARAPLPVECAAIAEGDLVITEIRGDQDGQFDLRGEWFEIHNTTGTPISLHTLRTVITRLDSGAETEDFVRDAALSVAAGEYITLGITSGAPELSADYVFEGALRDEGFASAVILEIQDCHQDVIDRVIMRSAPGFGTQSLDGGSSPQSVDNGDTATDAWCADDTPSSVPGTDEEEGIGTPGGANFICP